MAFNEARKALYSINASGGKSISFGAKFLKDAGFSGCEQVDVIVEEEGEIIIRPVMPMLCSSCVNGGETNSDCWNIQENGGTRICEKYSIFDGYSEKTPRNPMVLKPKKKISAKAQFEAAKEKSAKYKAWCDEKWPNEFTDSFGNTHVDAAAMKHFYKSTADGVGNLPPVEVVRRLMARSRFGFDL